MGTTNPLAPIVRTLAAENANIKAEKSANRAFTVTNVPPGAVPAHTVIRLSNGVGNRWVINKATADDSLSTHPPQESLASYYNRTQASVITNGSALWPDSGRWMGLTITNGQLIQGWEEGALQELGIESAVFMQDGTLRIYDRRTPPEQIIEDGGWNSFTFGQALYRDGVLTGIQSMDRYTRVTGRQMLGDTTAGDVVILTFPGKSDGSYGASARNVIDAVAGMGINNLYFCDSGGSAQTMVNGQYVVPSSDAGGSRTTSDALYFYAPSTTPADDTGWVNIALASGYQPSGAAPAVRRIGKEVELRGSVQPKPSGQFPASASVAVAGPGGVPSGSRPAVQSLFPACGNMAVSVNGGRLTVNTDGSLQVVSGANSSPYFSLSGIRYKID